MNKERKPALVRECMDTQTAIIPPKDRMIKTPVRKR
jgi:hypothetical protein